MKIIKLHFQKEKFSVDTNPKKKVFISYSRNGEEDWVRNILCNVLESSGILTDGDWKIDLYATTWRDQIREKIVAADIILFIISKASFDSDECKAELELVKEYSKKVVPVVRRRDYDKHDIHSAIANVQWLFMDRDEEFQSKINDLKKTINTNFNLVREHTDISIAAEQWNKTNQDSSLLLRGVALKKAEQWFLEVTSLSEKEFPKATDIQKEYLILSRKKQNGRSLRIYSALIASLIIFIALSIYSYNRTMQKEEADRLKNEEISNQIMTDSSIRLANMAISSMHVDPLQSLQEARKAVETKSTKEAINALRQLLLLVATINVHDFYGGKKKYAVFSHDRLITIGKNNQNVMCQLCLWLPREVYDLTDYSMQWDPEYFFRLPQSLPYEDGFVNSASFSPDGRSLVIGDGSNRAIILTGDGYSFDDSEPKILRHTKPVLSVAYSPSGDTILTSCEDGLLRMWSGKGKLYKNISCDRNDGSSCKIYGIAFSSDGKFVVTVSESIDKNQPNATNSVDIWETATWQIKYRWATQSIINGASFNNDGRYVIITTQAKEGQLFIWDWTKGIVPKYYEEMEKNATTAIFSPDNKYIIVGCSNGEIGMFNANSKEKVLTLSGQSEQINSLAFSSDGKYLVSASDDKTVFIRNMDNKIIKGNLEYLFRIFNKIQPTRPSRK